MATTPKQLFAIQLGTTVSGRYTAPASTSTRITSVTATNVTSTARKLSSVHMVPSGGSADATNQVVEDLVVPPNKSIRVPTSEGHIIEAGGVIHAGAEVASAISLVASGWEIV